MPGKRLTAMTALFFLLIQILPAWPVGLNDVGGSLQNTAIQGTSSSNGSGTASPVEPPVIAPGGLTGTDGGGATPTLTTPNGVAADDAGNEDYPDEINDQAFVILREGQSLDSAAVATLPFDARMKVLEQGEEWCKVRTRLGTGYIRTRYIKRLAGAGSARAAGMALAPLVSTPAAGTEMPNRYAGEVTLRGDMKLESEALGQIPPGAKVKFLAQENGWCKVEWNGKTGYMREMYLGIRPKAPARPTAEKPASTPQRIGSPAQTAASDAKGGGLSGRPVAGGRVTSEFGPRDLFGKNYHYGIDIGVPTGTPAKALGNGSVAKVGYDAGGGNYIDIKYDNGYTSRYYHMKDATLKAGARVSGGTVIGHTNNTGKYTTGPHLHFEIKDASGKRVNPRTVPGLTF